MRRLLAILALSIAACASATAAEPQALRLMTYNIRLDLASDGANAWPNRRHWVVSQVLWLRPDIVGLQEVLPNQKADLVRDLPRYRLFGGGRDDGKEKGEASPIGFDRQRFDLLGGGLFWLSPTPTVPSKGWDAAHNRIATWVRLRVRGTRTVILVVNTHWDHIGLIARKQSAMQITQWLDANRRRCEQVMLIGDFNSGIESDQLQYITGSSLRLRDARSVSKSAPIGPAATFNNFQVPPPDSKAIDHLLLGRQVEVERYLVLAQLIDGRWPSDHFPVLVDLQLAECR
jgi:endonuclease/exonuclease/phosphatase family metal-dependent hydrolase